MRASELIKGYLAIERVVLPLAKRADGDDGGGDANSDVTVGLRPLSPGQEADIYAAALAYARAHGLEKPEEGDELYEFGKALNRILIGVVDADAPTERFFDGGLEQIENMVELGKDGVLTLAEMHQGYQDRINGKTAELLSDDGFAAATKELAGPDGARFFFSRAPGWRLIYTLSSARLLYALATTKSDSSSDSATKPTINPKKTDAAPAKKKRALQ
jgi:hypothetical protein